MEIPVKGKKSISMRLLGVLAASVVMLITYSVTIVFGMVEHRKSIEQMYKTHLTSSLQLATANDHLWWLRYGFPQYLVLGKDDREKILQEEPELDREIHKILDNYAALKLPPNERDQLNLTDSSYDRYMSDEHEYPPPEKTLESFNSFNSLIHLIVHRQSHRKTWNNDN